jgi:hypothetical protein
VKFHVDAFFPAGFSLLELAFHISIQGSSRCLVRRLSSMSSRETHLGVPVTSREAIIRRTRESVDDDHLASDDCGLSRLAKDFSSLLI